MLVVLGLVFFLPIIAGMVLNTIFLVREIRRNEQHDSFINAVTHELKTPVASIRLYLQTLQARDLDEAKRREFYRIMLEDSDRLLQTIEQVLQAGQLRLALAPASHERASISATSRGNACELARTRFHLAGERWSYERASAGAVAEPIVIGDPDELKAAVWNLIDNAIKYSTGRGARARRARGDGRPATRGAGDRSAASASRRRN